MCFILCTFSFTNFSLPTNHFFFFLPPIIYARDAVYLDRLLLVVVLDGRYSAHIGVVDLMTLGHQTL